MPFIKGDPKINRNGRPKKFTIKDYLTEEDVKKLVDVAFEKANEGNTDMVKYLLDQALGKAPQSMDLTTGGKPLPLLGGLSNGSNNPSNKQTPEAKKED